MGCHEVQPSATKSGTCRAASRLLPRNYTRSFTGGRGRSEGRSAPPLFPNDGGERSPPSRNSVSIVAHGGDPRRTKPPGVSLSTRSCDSRSARRSRLQAVRSDASYQDLLMSPPEGWAANDRSELVRKTRWGTLTWVPKDDALRHSNSSSFPRSPHSWALRKGKDTSGHPPEMGLAGHRN